MAHARQQVRESAGTLLSASVAGLWNHVFETRIKPARDIYPFLMVYVDSEESTPELIHAPTLVSRDMLLSVRAYLKITDDEGVEDAMDAVAVEIESLLTQTALNTQLSGKLKSLALQSTAMAVDTDENERTSALLSLDWQVRVFTLEGQSETLI
jgi:hypothetical protein